MQKYEFKNRYGDVRRGVCWEITKPKANIMIFEGMEEHVTRYDDFAKFLNQNGYNVYALDTYGQGENVKEDLSDAGFWPEDGFAKMVCAHNEMIEEAKKQFPGDGLSEEKRIKYNINFDEKGNFFKP